ncbi:hypothetical protein, partial [Limnospira platensis]|uniref:hypothetical protein n=1 Tax=Limnospira platensis TaxID=118562 RepID=UPI00396CAF88
SLGLIILRITHLWFKMKGSVNWNNGETKGIVRAMILPDTESFDSSDIMGLINVNGKYLNY